MADSCCCPAVMSDHRAQPRCVSPSVTGEVVPGPRAKGQGCFSEGSSQEGWERRYIELGSREPMIALFVKSALMIVCSGHGDQDIFSDDQSSCLSQLLLNQIHPLLPSSQSWSRVLPLRWLPLVCPRGLHSIPAKAMLMVLT